MGLDISVNRICKKKDSKNDNYFRLIDNDGNYKNEFPSWTKEFETSITESWYDWQKFEKESGIDLNNCEWLGETYDKNGSFLSVCQKGIKMPEWNNGEGWKDFDEYLEARDKLIINIDLDKVPIYEKEIKVLYYEEVGYQRKGLNKLFYDDYENGKIGYFVWSKEELEKYKKDYCDEPYEYKYPNGEMSGKLVYPKDNFQRNIIDKFEEGKDCVTFSW